MEQDPALSALCDTLWRARKLLTDAEMEALLLADGEAWHAVANEMNALRLAHYKLERRRKQRERGG